VILAHQRVYKFFGTCTAKMFELKDAFEAIDNHRGAMVRDLISICKEPALAPENGGDGENKKVKLIRDIA